MNLIHNMCSKIPFLNHHHNLGANDLKEASIVDIKA